MNSFRLTDHVGFWMFVFGIFGLIMLGIAEPRINRRYQDFESRRVFVTNQDNETEEAQSLQYPKYSLWPVRVILFLGSLLGLVLLGMSWFTKRGKNLADSRNSQSMTE